MYRYSYIHPSPGGRHPFLKPLGDPVEGRRSMPLAGALVPILIQGYPHAS